MDRGEVVKVEVVDSVVVVEVDSEEEGGEVVKVVVVVVVVQVIMVPTHNLPMVQVMKVMKIMAVVITLMAVVMAMMVVMVVMVVPMAVVMVEVITTWGSTVLKHLHMVQTGVVDKCVDVEEGVVVLVVVGIGLTKPERTEHKWKNFVLLNTVYCTVY